MREEIDALEHWALKMKAINRHLFEDLGYAGDHDQYYDPRNSYLNVDFERRRANPISLAMVQMEAARRRRVPLAGVSFSGHFLVRDRNSVLKGKSVVVVVDRGGLGNIKKKNSNIT